MRSYKNYVELNEYLKCAENGDIEGMRRAEGCRNALGIFGYNAYLIGALVRSPEVMRQARDDGVDVHFIAPSDYNAYLVASVECPQCMRQARDDGVNINQQSHGLSAVDLAYMVLYYHCVKQAQTDGVVDIHAGLTPVQRLQVIIFKRFLNENRD